jgi:hypothetical protein
MGNRCRPQGHPAKRPRPDGGSPKDHIRAIVREDGLVLPKLMADFIENAPERVVAEVLSQDPSPELIARMREYSR